MKDCVSCGEALVPEDRPDDELICEDCEYMLVVTSVPAELDEPEYLGVE